MTTTSDIQLTARNASASDLVDILQKQKARKLDVVAPADKIKFRGGKLIVSNTVAELTEDGVTSAAGEYAVTEIFEEGLSAKLGIDRRYYRKMREAGRTDLLDGNVNGWLHGRKSRLATGDLQILHEGDPRAFLLRLFRGDDGQAGVARALLSDKYGLSMDNYDTLIAVTQGIRDAGVQPTILVSDLSERRIRVRFEFPELYQEAPGLLPEGYKSPFDGGVVRRAGSRDLEALRAQFGPHHIFSQKDAPIAYAGIDFDNSETGGGAYNLNPVVGLVRCTNGWVITRHGIRKIHRGAVLSEGVVRPSLETIRLAGQLVSSETKDSVAQWLTPGYLAGLVSELEEVAGTPIASPTEVVPAVCVSLGFTPEEAKNVLDFFIISGQPTAGGVGNAITAYVQTVDDVDRAFELERTAVPAMEAAASRS
jgi:hypothetical protein